jgi:hypothetical protein
LNIEEEIKNIKSVLKEVLNIHKDPSPVENIHNEYKILYEKLDSGGSLCETNKCTAVVKQPIIKSSIDEQTANKESKRDCKNCKRMETPCIFSESWLGDEKEKEAEERK